jgi:hypothetical protein
MPTARGITWAEPPLPIDIHAGRTAASLAAEARAELEHHLATRARAITRRTRAAQGLPEQTEMEWP